MSILYRRPGGAVNLREKLPDVKQRLLLPTVGTPDAGEPAARIAAVEIALHEILDDLPEKTCSRSKRLSYSVRDLSK